MEHSAYIILQNINPAQNKRRVYHITVTDFSVQLCWGRVGCQSRQIVVTFHEEGEMLKFLQVTLGNRRRHGYRVVRQSEGFPAVQALDLLEVQPLVPTQLALFSLAQTEQSIKAKSAHQ